MAQYREGYRTGRLWGLLVPLAAYLGWMWWAPTMSGVARIDGAVGVLLGLYAGAHPAANGIDLIFSSRRPILSASGWRATVWLLLNAVVLAAGLFAVIIGAAQFSVART